MGFWNGGRQNEANQKCLHRINFWFYANAMGAIKLKFIIKMVRCIRRQGAKAGEEDTGESERKNIWLNENAIKNEFIRT